MASASSKHRKNTPGGQEVDGEGSVLETTNPVKASPKRRTAGERPRNDDEITVSRRPSGQKPASELGEKRPTDLQGAEETTALDDAQGEGGKTSPKRRIGTKRPRNDETNPGVPETTNGHDSKDNEPNHLHRPRNDEYSEEGKTIDLFDAGDDAAENNSVRAYFDEEFSPDGDQLSKSDQASPKRRKTSVRPRNDDLHNSVPETTNMTAAGADESNLSERPRNDDSKRRLAPVKRGRPKLEPLTPVEDPDGELFICDVLDAIPKDDIPTMEHPIFTLATQPDMREIHYEHNGTIVDIWPSRLGLATIHDKDILIYCISQLIAKKNKGEPYGRKLRLQPYQLLTWARRQTSGDGYRRLVNALDRLSGTRIKTNIKTLDGIEYTSGVGLINEYNARRSSRTGQVIDVEITLSEWLFKMVEGANVLTLHRDYFSLRRSVDRRVYELARKHCGSQPKWSVSLEILKKKTGAGGTIRHFREDVRRLVDTNHLPDYTVEFDNDVVTFFSRAVLAAAAAPQPKAPFIEPETFNDARVVAPGYDVYALHREWVEWWQDGGCQPLRDANAAFLGFCRQKTTKKQFGR